MYAQATTNVKTPFSVMHRRKTIFCAFKRDACTPIIVPHMCISRNSELQSPGFSLDSWDELVFERKRQCPAVGELRRSYGQVHFEVYVCVVVDCHGFGVFSKFTVPHLKEIAPLSLV